MHKAYSFGCDIWWLKRTITCLVQAIIPLKDFFSSCVFIHVFKVLFNSLIRFKPLTRGEKVSDRENRFSLGFHTIMRFIQYDLIKAFNFSRFTHDWSIWVWVYCRPRWRIFPKVFFSDFSQKVAVATRVPLCIICFPASAHRKNTKTLTQKIMIGEFFNCVGHVGNAVWIKAARAILHEANYTIDRNIIHYSY